MPLAEYWYLSIIVLCLTFDHLGHKLCWNKYHPHQFICVNSSMADNYRKNMNIPLLQLMGAFTANVLWPIGNEQIPLMVHSLDMDTTSLPVGLILPNFDNVFMPTLCMLSKV